LAAGLHCHCAQDSATGFQHRQRFLHLIDRDSRFPGEIGVTRVRVTGAGVEQLLERPGNPQSARLLAEGH
jgi:hypothetical protein